MLALIILANPSPNSFSHAMASAAKRVLVARGIQGIPVGLLRARHAIVVNTSNTPAEREAAVFGDPLETLWKNCVFGLCGVSSVIRRMADVTVVGLPSTHHESFVLRAGC